MSVEVYWIFVALTTIFSAARLTRLATVDKFPPVKWLRDKYEDKTDGTGWQMLTLCGYCFSFWATLLVVLTGLAATAYDDPNEPVGDDLWPFLIWWVVNGTLAASYAAAIVMAHDGDLNDEETIVLKTDES